jgi:hypothetical protein
MYFQLQKCYQPHPEPRLPSAVSTKEEAQRANAGTFEPCLFMDVLLDEKTCVNL